MFRKVIVAVFLVLTMSGCDLVAAAKDMMAQSEAVALTIEKQVGVKPVVGFNYNNGTFTNVTVQFHVVPAAGLAELEKVARAAVRETFKDEPESIVVSFVFEKKS